MVQFKKSPIEPLEPPKNFPNDTEVWVIEATGEVFATYDAYLRKLDYYRQKLFSCEITGHRHMTFFEALKSEKLGMREIDTIFPDSLRVPLLRKVQFSTIPRTDDLVNHLYDTFKDDYFPGEQVTIDDPITQQRLTGKIGEKQQILGVPSATPNKQAPTARYYVHVPGNPGREVMVTNKEVFRDRRSFTKQVLRSFLKHTIYRERFDGAPWQVKEDVAKRYKIDTKVPAHLTVDAILAQRKAAAALKRSKANAHTAKEGATFAELRALALQIREHKGKLPQDLVLRFHEALESVKDPFLAVQEKRALKEARAVKEANKEAKTMGSKKAAAAVRPREKTPSPSPPPLPKYPIEDLEVDPKPDAAPRPLLKFLHQGSSSLNYPESSQSRDDIEAQSVGTLLEIWNTLNVHGSFFVLDSFTFDDFVEAMLFSSEDVTCELFSEIHCAVLKTLVNTDGEPEASIPALSSSSESSSADSSAASSPGPNGAVTTTQTKSRRTKDSPIDELQMTDAELSSSLANGHVNNRARELLQGYDWVERIRDRDFSRGGWQTALVGLLQHMLQAEDDENEVYKNILSHLTPEDQTPSRETVRRQYMQLNVNLRTAALQTALLLSVTSKSFKDAMESRSEQQTIDRKEKVDAQRRKKPLVQELQELDTQRKLQRPDPVQDSSDLTVNGVGADTSAAVDGAADAQLNEDTEAESEDEMPHKGRSLRRTVGRANELKRKREEEERIEREKKAKLEEASLTPEEREYRKILKEIEKKKEEIKECEDEVAEVEQKLRENACHRTRSLGKDRFFNRYWWFERNGMPYAGQETSSTAHYGYANGRLWIQGADELEQDGYFNPTEQEIRQYRLKTGMTVHERRKKEEGDCSLVTAHAWGFYDTPEQLDALISWLDDRGNRERELQKELQIWRDKIAEYMDAMNTHVKEVVEKKLELEEAIVGIATRKKAHADNNPTKYPCLAWTNTLALIELGHLHSDGAAPKKVRGVARLKEKPAPPGRRETRRGTRF